MPIRYKRCLSVLDYVQIVSGESVINLVAESATAFDNILHYKRALLRGTSDSELRPVRVPLR